MSKVIGVLRSDARLFADSELGQSNYLNRHIVNDARDSFQVTLLEGHCGDRCHNFELRRRIAEIIARLSEAR
jgi:hypothetical protein